MARVTQAMAMARKMVMVSNDDDNHNNGNDSNNDDNHKGQMLPIAEMCCQTHKSDALAIL
jgi:hypothetical protein